MAKTLWVTDLKTNLLVPAPAGAALALETTSQIKYLEGKQRAESVAKMYRDAAIKLDPRGDMAQHIAAACEASDHWLVGKVPGGMKADLFFRTIQMDTIATSVLAAKECPKLSEHLRYLMSGSLDIFAREPSKAKSTLWELELHALLRAKKINATLDEPDIVARVSDVSVGIACKRIFSDENVEKTLSYAVEQIERVSEYGLLSINIDDLWPPNRIRTATSTEYFGYTLTQENLAFLNRHDRHFRKYLKSGRVMGAMIASGGVGFANGRYVSARQFTIWSVPDIEPAKLKVLRDLQGVLQRNWN